MLATIENPAITQHSNPLAPHGSGFVKAMHLISIPNATPRLLITAMNQHPCPKVVETVAYHVNADTCTLTRVVRAVEALTWRQEAMTVCITDKQTVELLEAVIANRVACTVELATVARTLIESIEQKA